MVSDGYRPVLGFERTVLTQSAQDRSTRDDPECGGRKCYQGHYQV